MTPFSCSITVAIEGQILCMKLKNSQLWYLQFDSSASMAAFFHEIERQSIFYAPSSTMNHRQTARPSPLKVQIVSYQITRDEEQNFYYQQRYHATENENVVNVKDFIGQTNSPISKLLQETFLKNRLTDPVTRLSTGEFKIACLLKSFQDESDIIFYEELFAGLDANNRYQVIQFLHTLKKVQQACILVATTQPFETSLFDYSVEINTQNNKHDESVMIPQLKYLFPMPHRNHFQNAFKLSDVSVKYNEQIILQSISWTVKKHEKWALHGKNGSGKSTLLSLVNADHPQAYAQNILLFDQPREYGRNIWEIKEQIGFFSHEFFRFFDKNKTVTDTIVAILSNPYKPLSNRNEVLKKFNILRQYFELPLQLLDKPLNQLSQYQQRMIVLMGVLLKNAPLLILDEPYHFFDQQIIKKFNFLLDNYLEHCTLIFASHSENDFPACIQHHFYLS